MKYALITGANKSIGLETARQLLQQGYYVFVGSRDLANGQQGVASLRADGLTEAEAVQLDVTSADSVRAARAVIGQKTAVLDVLINNAGILGGMSQPTLTTGLSLIREVFETNVFGVIAVTQAFIDLLRLSAAPRIVNVTTGLASLTLHHDPTWRYYNITGAAYHPSKAALNAYTVMLAQELRDTPFKVNAVDPGYTATDFNHHSGPGTVPDAAARVVKAALLTPEDPTGQFFSDDNAPQTGISPW